MSVGTIDPDVLTDIANAIRIQNGTATKYKPGQMAAAVTALDGDAAGTASIEPYGTVDTGVLSDSVFAAIAGAIRGQNEQSTTYTPGQMAAAILALEWDVGLKPRCLLLDNGTMEFNYLEKRRSTVGGRVVQAFEVAVGGYTSVTARPWDGVKLLVDTVVIDSSFANAGVTSCAYWFNGFSNLVEVHGFENLSGTKNTTQMFTSCGCLESIYATSFAYTTVTSSSSMFYGATRLVGGMGFVPTTSSAASVCKLGTGGVLTNPADDQRRWCYGFVYADGELVIAASSTAAAGRTLVATGRVCVNATYNAVGATWWYANRSTITRVTFAADMTALTAAGSNLDYWFYGHSALANVVGLNNLSNVHEMKYTFNACIGLHVLDFGGFAPSGFTNLTYTFGGCTALTTILVDSGWALPSGVTGSATFYNCKALAGGAGTVYASSRITPAYFRIDGVGGVGYATVG